jgi:hypothetical protein
MDAGAYRHLLQKAEEIVKTITLALAEEKNNPRRRRGNAGHMLNIML